jgi:hypothetical protein
MLAEGIDLGPALSQMAGRSPGHLVGQLYRDVYRSDRFECDVDQRFEQLGPEESRSTPVCGAWSRRLVLASARRGAGGRQRGAVHRDGCL